jgi:hypothetical protein
MCVYSLKYGDGYIFEIVPLTPQPCRVSSNRSVSSLVLSVVPFIVLTVRTSLKALYQSSGQDISHFF